MKILEKLVEFILKSNANEGFDNPLKLRKKMNRAARILLPEVKKVVLDNDKIAEIPVLWIRSENSTKKICLYLHGGAYVVGSIETHKGLVATIMQQANMDAIIVDYRLAPEHCYPAALEDATIVYQYLLYNGYNANDIAVGGDSAGGGLALALLLYLRDKSIPLPKCAVLLCPWIDLTNSSTTYETNNDILLHKEHLDVAAKMYAVKNDLKNPYISPLYGDFKELPPIVIHSGGRDALQGENLQFVEKARKAGVDIVHFNDVNGIHVWHAYYPFFKHAKSANTAIAEYLRKQFI